MQFDTLTVCLNMSNEYLMSSPADYFLSVIPNKVNIQKHLFLNYLYLPGKLLTFP